MPWPVMWKKPLFVQALRISDATAFRSSRDEENDEAMSISGTVNGLDGALLATPLAKRALRYA
jgi:hypothetical protein